MNKELHWMVGGCVGGWGGRLEALSSSTGPWVWEVEMGDGWILVPRAQGSLSASLAWWSSSWGFGDPWWFR